MFVWFQGSMLPKTDMLEGEVIFSCSLVSDLVTQIIAWPLRKRKVEVSNPTVGNIFFFILQFSLSSHSSQLESAHANEINRSIQRTCFIFRFDRKNMMAVMYSLHF